MFAQSPVADAFVAGKRDRADILVDVVQDAASVGVSRLFGNEGKEGIEDKDQIGSASDGFGKAGCTGDSAIFIITAFDLDGGKSRVDAQRGLDGFADWDIAQFLGSEEDVFFGVLVGSTDVQLPRESAKIVGGSFDLQQSSDQFFKVIRVKGMADKRGIIKE